MKEEEKSVIKENYGHLLSTIIAKDLTPHFVEKSIISFDDDQEIRAIQSQRDQNFAFLIKIVKKSGKAFETLISSLRKNQDDYTANLLENGFKEKMTGKSIYEGQSRTEQEDVARCPLCSRPLVCNSCSPPIYDEGFSARSELSSTYPPRGLHRVHTFPITTNISGGSPVFTADDTLPKTTDSLGYEPLRFQNEDEEPAVSGLDYPDGTTAWDLTEPENANELTEVNSDDDSYVNVSKQDYTNVSPDKKRIKLKVPLELQITEIDPEVKSNKHFTYYEKHLGQEKGWYPLAYRIEDIEKLLKEHSTEKNQYLIWYEGTKDCLPFISVHSKGIIHHFRIHTSGKTEVKPRMFFIDNEYEFRCLEQLIEHVKRYGISLDKEYRPEAAMF